jgi:hypothetical protein
LAPVQAHACIGVVVFGLGFFGVVHMKAMWLGLALLGGAMTSAAPAFAQDDEMVVVTGSRILSDDEYQEEFGSLPYISIKAPADFVIFTVDLESATKSVAERDKELERSFTQLAQRVSRTQGVTLEVGQPGRSSARAPGLGCGWRPGGLGDERRAARRRRGIRGGRSRLRRASRLPIHL